MHKRKPTFICGGDYTPEAREQCRNPLHNWPLARGYVDASEMAARRLRTGWSNPKCPWCGLYGWTPGKLHDTDTISLPPKGQAMNAGPIYCSAEVYPQTRYQPRELCENEVDYPGDLCARHDEDDRADEAYDNYLESLRKDD